MEQNILLSKIGASPTDTGWSQTYSTHYLYLVISLKQQLTDQEVGPLGKELLEKLQREFFALADKKLTNIKEAVTNCISIIPEEIEYSIVVATVPSDVLYVVIAGNGQVLIKRGESYHKIAHGAHGQVKGFSGKLKHADIVILETHDFAKKITEDTIRAIPHVTGVLDLSENLAPQIHEESEGTEAAIFLQYQNTSQAATHLPIVEPEPVSEPHHQAIRSQIEPEYPPLEMPDEVYPEVGHHKKNLSLPSLPHIKLNKKLVLALGIIILLGVLAVSIQREQSKKNQKQANESLIEVLKPAEEKYKEGLELASLNQALALEDFQEAEKMLVEKDSEFPKGTEARTAYDKLLADIRSQLDSYQQGESADTTVFFDPTKEQLTGATAVTFKGGAPAIVDSSKKAVLLKTDGTVDTTYDVDSTKLIALTGNENVLLVLGSDGIYQVDKKASSGKKIISDTGLTSVDVFGSNLYSTDGTTINKYSGEGFGKSSYFVGSPKLASGISDFAIDGAVWIIEKNGTIHKFLKGAEETFKISNLPSPIGKNPKLYTGEDVKSLYVLDPANKRVVVIGKDGVYKAAYSVANLNPTSVTASETEGKVYITSGGKVYSFEIK